MVVVGPAAAQEWTHPSLAGSGLLTLPDAALWTIPGQGHFAVWKHWEGSELAAELFPTVSLEFLAEKRAE